MLAIESIEINGEEETCKAVNLIIGANNSGKSTLLRELSISVNTLVIQENHNWLTGMVLKIEKPREAVKSMFPKINFNNIGDFQQYEGEKFTEKTGFKLFRPNVSQSGTQYFNQGLVSNYLNLPNDNPITLKVEGDNPNQLASKPNYWFFRLMSVTDAIEEFCESRLQAQLSANVQNLMTQRSETIMHHLLSEPDQLKQIEDNIRSVFGIEIGFDDLQQGDKPLRIMPERKIRPTQNRRKDAEEWHKKSPLLMSQGDGIRAYLKLIFSLLDDNRSLVFIDEPEAFLHPPQRRELGALVAKLAKEKSKQVFIATHDSEFLRGALSATKDIKVFNIKRHRQNHNAQSVNISDFRNLTNNQPEILNERILNSFFYGKTIITESETDRVFYEYVSALYHWELFQNKNFVGLSGIDKALNLFAKLRELDLNVAVVVDVDFLSTRKYPQHINDTPLKTMHDAFKQKFNNSYDINKLKKDGYSYLQSVNPNLAKDFLNLLKKYAEYGVFILEVGELESWSNSTKNDREHMIGYATTSKRRKLAIFTKEILS